MTKIEWAHAGTGRGKSWNPIRARDRRTGKQGWHCEKVSPACANCYAEAWNARPGIGGTGLLYKPGRRSDVDIYLDEQTLLAPLHWKQPTGIFACSMTDVFGDWVHHQWIDRMLAVAMLCPQHIFIFLTKRSARMRAYFKGSTDLHFEPPVQRVQGFVADFVRLGKFQPTGYGPIYNEDWKRAEARFTTLPARECMARRDGRRINEMQTCASRICC